MRHTRLTATVEKITAWTTRAGDARGVEKPHRCDMASLPEEPDAFSNRHDGAEI